MRIPWTLSAHARRATRRAAIAALLLALPAAAQERAPTGRIEGTVSDSMRARPLAGAIVLLTRMSPLPSAFYSTATDERGRYHLDSLSAGRYSLAFSHPVLDSLELVLPSREIELEEGRTVRMILATPSSATLRAAACPGIPLPKGTGALVGQVDDADRDRPLAGATVAISWSDLAVDHATLRSTLQERSANARTDSTGSFRFCGLPTDVFVVMQVQGAGRAGSALRVAVPDSVGVVVARLSFSPASSRALDALADTTSADSATAAPLTGTAVLTGTVRGLSGQPVSGAQVRVLDGAPVAHSDSSGAFTLSGLPAGSQLLEVRQIGYLLGQQRVELRSGRTVTSDVRLSRIVSLDSIRIVAQRSRYREFESRAKRAAFGTFLTEDQIQRRNAFETSDLLRMSGFRIMGSGIDTKIVSGRGIQSISQGPCITNIVIDGMQHQDINLVRPSDIGALEIYRGQGGAPVQYDSGCGLIVIHTRR